MMIKIIVGVIGVVWVYLLVVVLLLMMGWRVWFVVFWNNVCFNDNVESYIFFMVIGSFFIFVFIMLSINIIVYCIVMS